MCASPRSVAEVGVLVDLGLIEIDQLMPVALGGGQYRTQPRDEGLPPRGIGAAEQLLGLLPRQAEPVQGGADGLAAARTGEPRLHKPDQPLERPARLRVGAGYGRPGRLSLSSADRRTERGLDLRAKGGTAPRAPILYRLGAAFVVAVQPPHHGLRVSPGTLGHSARATASRDLVQGQPFDMLSSTRR